MNIHSDTNLCIQPRNWDILCPLIFLRCSHSLLYLYFLCLLVLLLPNYYWVYWNDIFMTSVPLNIRSKQPTVDSKKKSESLRKRYAIKPPRTLFYNLFYREFSEQLISFYSRIFFFLVIESLSKSTIYWHILFYYLTLWVKYSCLAYSLFLSPYSL